MLECAQIQPILRRLPLCELRRGQYLHLDCWGDSHFLDFILDFVLLFKKFLLYFKLQYFLSCYLLCCKGNGGPIESQNILEGNLP